MLKLPTLKISIITATYNNADTIETTVHSILAQTYKNIEYIIIDGASNDGTLEKLEEYRTHLTCLVSEPDNGMYHALNKGIEKATGQVIGFLHADDFYASNDTLEKVANLFIEKNCDAVYGNLQYVYRNEITKVLRNWESGKYQFKNMKKGWMPPHPTLFVKKHFYNQYGNFDTSFKVAADYELMTRFLCKHKMKPYYIPEVLIKMRWGGKSNKNIRNLIIKMLDDYRAIKKNKVGNLLTLVQKNTSKINQFFHKG